MQGRYPWHMTPDEILLEAAPNFRDFGGYANTDGHRVRRRRLYRSELLLELLPRDLETLATLGIGLVCDLRTPGERKRLSNDWPRDAAFETIALDVGAELSAVQPAKWSRRLADPGFDAARAHEALCDNYRRMPASYAGDLRALFERLSQPDARPVLVHCAAGKDRTGFVCAMLLSALGVPRETVFADYLATLGRFTYDRLVRTRLHAILDGKPLPPHAEAAMRVLASVHADFLEAAFEVVLAQHGSVDVYLERVCALTPQRRDALRTQLLEPAG